MQATSPRIVDGDGCCSTGRPSASSVADRLRTSMAETARLLVDFEREQEQVVFPDINTYERCCKQLVVFMATHMETSQDFVQQMAQVIRASYVNSSRFTFTSTGVEHLWLRYDRNARAESDAQIAVVSQTPSFLEPTIRANMATTVRMTVTPHVVEKTSGNGLRPTCSPHVTSSESTPSTVGKEGKRQAKKGRLVPRQDLKRARHMVARNLYGAGSLDCKDEEDIGMENVTENQTETVALGESFENSTSGERVDNSILPDDRIVWPCAGTNPLDRNPAFLEHLRLAVALIDAKNCCPPPGMKCIQECTSLRSRMCPSHRIQGGNAGVCHDTMCCVWRDIDTHLVRCRNSDCEFKNSVGLRQAMHDILQNEIKLKTTSDKLLAAKALISETAGARDHQSASFSEIKIKRLEEKCAELEDAVHLHKDRQRAFKQDLNALGIPPAKCESEIVPSFQSHYAMKRPIE